MRHEALLAGHTLLTLLDTEHEVQAWLLIFAEGGVPESPNEGARR